MKPRRQQQLATHLQDASLHVDRDAAEAEGVLPPLVGEDDRAVLELAQLVDVQRQVTGGAWPPTPV